MPLPSKTKGFILTLSSQSLRLLELKFAKETVDAFVKAVAQWPVQALEYKSFLRFRVGQILTSCARAPCARCWSTPFWTAPPVAC
ncbi:hypothetical protein QF020_000849 [Pseudomonas frederiksbergensis]|jgi:protein CsiD